MSTTHRPEDPAAGIDFTTPEGLRQVIEALNAHDAWASSPTAAELMVYAQTKYTPDREGLAPGPGGRDLTSQDKARRPTKRPGSSPARAGHYEDFLFDVHPRPADTGAREEGVDKVVRAAAVFLVITGWAARPVEQAVDYLVHRVCGLTSREAAAETAAGDLHIATRLGFAPDAWRGLVRLTVGRTPRGGEPERGLFARVLLGDHVADLLADEQLVAASKALTGRGLP